jgi:DNA-binding transcriptional ArsR family regulator
MNTLQASKRTETVPHQAKGRKRGSGYTSQIAILLVLTNGAATSSYIRRLSGLNKDTVCSNLQILKGIRAVIAERQGRSVVYRLGERPFWKWVFFHAFLGTRWARKALKVMKRLYADLPTVMKPIEEMYGLVRKNAELYNRLKEKRPELKGEDIWTASWLLDQFRYVDKEGKFRSLSGRCWTVMQVRKRGWEINRKVQRKSVGESCLECGGTSFIKDYTAGETVCGTCGIVIREREMEDPWFQRERMGLKRQWRAKRRMIGSHHVPRMRGLERERYLEDRENFGRFYRQLSKGFRVLQENLVGRITFSVYCDFLQTCFPEVVDFAAEHEIECCERLTFEHAIKFDELVSQLVKAKTDKVEEFSGQLMSEIDYIHDYTIGS